MTAQTYATHRYRPRAWTITVLLSMVATGVLATDAVREPSLGTIGAALLAVTVMVTVVLLRAFALRLQNRIIRLEMRTRLARLGREADVDRVTQPQLIALRFASDAELPALIDRAVAKGMSADEIKRAVTDWQSDHART